MRRLRWTERASADLFDIAVYYRAVDPRLANLLLDRVVEAPNVLLTQPAIGTPTGSHGSRKWTVRKTPFLLTYRILRDGTIEVLRVHHNRKNWRPE